MAKTTKTPGAVTSDGSGADELMALAGMNPPSQDAQDGDGSATDNATGQEPTAEPTAEPLSEPETNPANIAPEEVIQPAPAAGPEPLPAIQPQNEPPAKIELPAPRPQPFPRPQVEPAADPIPEDDSPMYPGDAEGASASELHAARLKKYGPDYVVTVRPGTNQRQIWSRSSWKMIRGDKGGWKEVSPIPAEVRNLNK